MAKDIALRSILLALMTVVTIEVTPVTSVPIMGKRLVDLKTRGAGSCIINGHYYAHGQEFTMPGTSHCLTYRCNQGGYDIHKEGCEVENQCYDVGKVFSVKCTTYQCEKSSPRPNMHMYQAVAISHRCRDFYGSCRTPGDRFSYALSGFLYHDCSCSINNNYVRYTCIG